MQWHAANTPICGSELLGYDILQTLLLPKKRAHIDGLILPINKTRKEKGSTLVFDGWSNPQRKPLINMNCEDWTYVSQSHELWRRWQINVLHSNGIIKVIKETDIRHVVQAIKDNATLFASSKPSCLRQISFGRHVTSVLSIPHLMISKNVGKNNVTYEGQWTTDVAGMHNS